MSGEVSDQLESLRAAEDRQRAVLGDGPRIAPLTLDDYTEDARALVAQMVSITASIESRDQFAHLVAGPEGIDPAIDVSAELAKLPDMIPTMAHHPALFSRTTEVGVQLLVRGVLPPRERELTILRVAWLSHAPYEWGEHVIIGKHVGLTGDEIEAVTRGSDAPRWTRHERAMLRAAEELLADATIADATWATLTETYDTRQLIELTILIGQYQAVAFYQNALRIRLQDGNPGLTAR